MKSDYVSLWYTQFRKLRASKGSFSLLCNDTEFDLWCVRYVSEIRTDQVVKTVRYVFSLGLVSR